MSRGLWIGLGLCLAGAASISAQEAPKFKGGILPDAIRFVSNISPDKQVGTMIFDNFILSTDDLGAGSDRNPNAKLKKLTYVLQPESDGNVCVVQYVRGFVATEGSGSASLIIHAAGKTTSVDLDEAIKTAKNPPKGRAGDIRAQAKKQATEQGFTVDSRPSKSDDFMVEIKSHIPVGQPIQTTLLILVDRVPGEKDAGALIHIDSVDFNVLPPEKDK
ncbi:MAG: hypothetical protein ABL888_16545 [Pirellulaceae bacterium]